MISNTPVTRTLRPIDPLLVQAMEETLVSPEKDIRLSRFFSFPVMDTKPIADVIELMEEASHKGDLDVVQLFIVSDERYELMRSLISYLIDQPGVVDYLCDYVLPTRWGEWHGVMGECVREALEDVTLWNIKETLAYRHVNPCTTQDIHADTFVRERGELRISYSPHFSIEAYEGIHIHQEFVDRPSPVIIDGASTENVVTFPACEMVLWESSSGVHARPLFTQEQLDECGGARFMMSISFEFIRVMDRANELFAARLLDKAAEPLSL